MKWLQYFSITCMLLSLVGCTHKEESANLVKQSYIHKYGVTVSKEEWEKRGQNGTIVSTLETGEILSEEYVDGFLHGEATLTFPHSNTVAARNNYQYGNLVSEAHNYANGQTQHEINYQSEGIATHTYWYENGKIRASETLHQSYIESGEYFTLNGEVESQVIDGEGNRTIRDDVGHLVAKEAVELGDVTEAYTFHENGDPKSITPYYHGQIHGIVRTFHPGGVPATQEEWHEGQLEGVALTFQNGELFSEQPYVSGEKHGTEKRYRNGHTIVEEITWVNGKKHGPSTLYLDDTQHTAWFHNDHQVSKNVFDNLVKHIR